MNALKISTKHEICYTLCSKLSWRSNRLTSDHFRGGTKLIGLNKFSVPQLGWEIEESND